MKNRREFIRTSLFTAFGLSALRGWSKLPIPHENSWQTIQDQFPGSDDYVYLNTGTMGLSPVSVQERYIQVIKESNTSGNYHRYEKTLYDALSTFIHCSTHELALTKNVTDGINIAVWGLPLEQGDEVILTTHEHAGNAIPWMIRADKDKLQLRLIDLGNNGTETLENIQAAINAKTKVIAVPHIPCTIGHILPIKEICSMAKSRGIYSCIDGAHGPGMLPIDVKDLNCDIYASCFHKWMLGPKGMGFLYINEEMLPKMNSYFSGEHSTLPWSFEDGKVKYNGLEKHTAKRYYYGTQSDPQQAAALESIKFLNDLGMEKVSKEIAERSGFLSKELERIEHVKLLNSTNTEEVGGIVSFKLPQHDFMEISTLLRKDGFRIRIVPESGINCIRVSTHIYNSFKEIELFITSLKRLVQ